MLWVWPESQGLSAQQAAEPRRPLEELANLDSSDSLSALPSCSEVFTAVSAHGAASRVQRAAFRAGDVHGAGKGVGDEGAGCQDGDEERNLDKRCIH